MSFQQDSCSIGVSDKQSALSSESNPTGVCRSFMNYIFNHKCEKTFLFFMFLNDPLLSCMFSAHVMCRIIQSLCWETKKNTESPFCKSNFKLRWRDPGSLFSLRRLDCRSGKQLGFIRSNIWQSSKTRYVNRDRRLFITRFDTIFNIHHQNRQHPPLSSQQALRRKWQF